MLKRRLTNSQGIPEMPSVPLLNVLGKGNRGGHAGSPVETVRRRIPDNFIPPQSPLFCLARTKRGQRATWATQNRDKTSKRPGIAGVPRNEACKAIMVCGEGVSQPVGWQMQPQETEVWKTVPPKTPKVMILAQDILKL